MTPYEKFATWFFGEVAGLWLIWSSFMSLRFMIEVAQHQHASFAIHGNQPSAGLFAIPVFLSVLGSVIWVVVAANEL